MSDLKTERPLVSPVVKAFAERLRVVYAASGLTYRQIGEVRNYSHAPMVRAAQGESLPTWPVAKAFLEACGVEDLGPWHERWVGARNAQNAFQLAAKRGWSQMGVEESRSEFGVTRQWPGPSRLSLDEPRPLLGLIRETCSTRQLAEALTRLRQRRSQSSLRQIEEATGLPRATLAGWFAGTRKPDADRLDQLALALGASRAEQREFARSLERIGGPKVWNGQPIVTVDIGNHVGNGGYELQVTCSGDDVQDGRIRVAPRQPASIMGVNNNPYDRTHGLRAFGQPMASEAVIPPTRRSNRRALLGFWLSNPAALHGKEIAFLCTVATSKGTWQSTPSATFHDPEAVGHSLRTMSDDEQDEYPSSVLVMDRYDY